MNSSTFSSASSGASVVGAFRELQAKIKHVELDREASFRERDKLQIELNESRRYLANARRDTEANATEHILERRRRSDELSLEIAELKMRIDVVQDSMTLTREKFEAHRQELDFAMKNSKEVKGKISQAQRSVEVLRNDISMIDARCRSLQEEVDLFRTDSVSPQKECTESKVRSLERELSDQKGGCEKASLRLDALQNYVGLLLQINGDLCSTMSSQEEARSKIARLSAQFLATPSSAWLADDMSRASAKSASAFTATSSVIEGQKKAIKKKKKNKNETKLDMVCSGTKPPYHTFTSYQRLLMQLASRKSATTAATAATAAANLVEASVNSRSGTPQRAFIPSSTRQNAKEFNVVATVSKASREAARLNASFASKVKSLDDAEIEKTLFHNVRRVGLTDMLEHLSTVKQYQNPGRNVSFSSR